MLKENPEQKEFDFTPQITSNNPESLKILVNNLKHFAGQNRLVLDLLMKGEKLTTKSAMNRYNIGDLQGRVRDLKKKGFTISFKRIEGLWKEYFFSPDDKLKAEGLIKMREGE